MTTTELDVGTAAGLLRLGNAFCDAKALLTAVELDLFGVLKDGPATEEEIRERLRLHGRGLSDFLHLLAALGVLVKSGEAFGNAAGAQRHLVPGGESYIGGFLQRSNRNLYPAWGRLSEALRTGKPQSGGSFAEVLERPAVLRQFIGMMDALTQQLAPALVEAFPWSRYGSLLDVGGCRGNLAAHLVTANPGLRGHVFDLPPMAPFFAEHVEAQGVADRLEFHGGDFFADPLPAADVVVLGHVLHDWDADQRRQLVRAAYAATNPGGALVVYDRMLDDDPRHVENLVISLDMLLVTDGGSEYPVQELRAAAAEAGFERITDRPLGDFDTIVVCHKP
ncbi:methyltransferase [Phytohabitans aurantiacus]|jgi:SAM-dependent methyltransferase|uniref:O-methyltransferase n=1 Tax=Phytohabitans aurantiacus TaxID=3016789 RepID=A0ABQ5QX42_9ACTN|nr:methyltransferase [Phytohabitans aurantiacus]GLH98487.1 O-methyltransferase [Phytohabitans aurantiacus]